MVRALFMHSVTPIPEWSLDVRESNRPSLPTGSRKEPSRLRFFARPCPPSDIAFYSLLQSRCSCAAIRHALANARQERNNGALIARAATTKGFILVRRPGAPACTRICQRCREQGFTPRIVAEVDRMLTIFALWPRFRHFRRADLDARLPCEKRGYCPLRNSRLAAPMTLAYREQEKRSCRAAFIALGKTLAKAWGAKAEMPSRANDEVGQVAARARIIVSLRAHPRTLDHPLKMGAGSLP